MQHEQINDYKITIFESYEGKQLFIESPAGETVYVHRVAGDPIERAKQVINQQ